MNTLNTTTLSPCPPQTNSRSKEISQFAAKNVLNILTTALQNRLLTPSAAKIACTDEIPEPDEESRPEHTCALPHDFLQENPRILIADDSPSALKLNVCLAKKMGFLPQNIQTATNREQASHLFAQALAKNTPFHVIFSDREMGNKDDGDKLAADVSRHAQGTRAPHFVMISATLPSTLPPHVHFGLPKGADAEAHEQLAQALIRR